MLANSPQCVVKLVKQEMEKYDREYLVAIFLDASNKVVAIEEVSKGTLNSSPVSARELFKSGILSNAASVVILHNHPSGECRPSDDDIRVTKMLSEAGTIIGIRLLDHIIVGADEGYTSFKEANMI